MAQHVEVNALHLCCLAGSLKRPTHIILCLWGTVCPEEHQLGLVSADRQRVEELAALWIQGDVSPVIHLRFAVVDGTVDSVEVLDSGLAQHARVIYGNFPLESESEIRSSKLFFPSGGTESLWEIAVVSFTEQEAQHVLLDKLDASRVGRAELIFVDDHL